VLELLVAISLTTIITRIAIINMRQFSNPADNGAAQLAAFFKATRQQGMTSTRAYKISPTSNSNIKTSYADTCSAATFTDDTALTFKLPSGAILLGTTWSLCYTPRGLSSSSANIQLNDGTKTRTVQVVLGGAVRVL
jgi:Tfp pilus assembly protein FimT